MISFITRVAAVAAAGVAFTSLPASAQLYTSNLIRSNSPVVGNADFTLQLVGNQLSLSLHLTGAEANMPHPIDLHGFSGGAPSQLPTVLADLDGDSIMESNESASFLGPSIMSLGAPTASATGTIDYSQTFTINPAVIGDLTKRTIEIHGRTVASGIGTGGLGEVNGTGGYKTELPIASGLITFAGALPGPAIPLPAAAWTGASTMACLAVAGALKKNKRPR